MVFRSRFVLSFAVTLLVTPVLFYAQIASSSGLRVVRKVTLGGDGRWDYLAVDTAARRVYISRETHVMVVDADDGKILGDIPNTPGVHGIALVPEMGKGFISNGRDSSVTVFDLRSLKQLGSIRAGQNPDAIVYDPASKRVFTFNGASRDATAIDARSSTVAGTVPLGAKPEFAAADGDGRMYVNLEDRSKIAMFDTRSLEVKARWSLGDGREPSGLALDIKNKRLFSVCGNNLMIVMEAETGNIIASLPIGDRVDGVAFDPERHMIYSSNGDGTLTVVQQDSPNSYHVAENVATDKGARTLALDGKTHRIYLVTAQFGPTPAATPEHPRPRPGVLPGSFEMLIVGMGAR